MAARGADLAIADIQLEVAQATASEIAAQSGQKVIAVEVNVADLEMAQAMVKTVVDEFGKVDILVNNAGITRDDLLMRMKEADWDDVININLKGAWNCSKAVIRPMMKKRYGRIVNISSVSGRLGKPGKPTICFKSWFDWLHQSPGT